MNEISEQTYHLIQKMIAEIESLQRVVEYQAGELDRLTKENRVLKEEIKTLQVTNRSLQERVNTNSENSSLPPSHDRRRKKKKKRTKKSINPKDIQAPKTSPKKSGASSQKFKKADHTVNCLPPAQCNCGGSVVIDWKKFEKLLQFEIPEIRPTLTEYRLHKGICPQCGTEHEGSLPTGVPKTTLGVRALAVLADVVGNYHLSRREALHCFKEIFSIPVSLGTISESEQWVSDALKQATQEAAEAVREAPRVNMDETGSKRSGEKMWLWVAVCGLFAVFSIHSSRSSKVAKAILGEHFKGILTSDRCPSYNFVPTNQRQFCWAHLIRDFIRVAERSGTAERLGMEILAHIKRMFSLWHRLQGGEISRSTFQKAMHPIRNQVEKLLIQGVEEADDKTAGSFKQILKFKEALWTFVDHEGVAPTNNLAEQTLRSFVIWRKKSFGTQSERGDRFAERVLTVQMSCRLQKRSFLTFVTETLKGYYGDSDMPSLLPHFEKIEQAA